MRHMYDITLLTLMKVKQHMTTRLIGCNTVSWNKTRKVWYNQYAFTPLLLNLLSSRAASDHSPLAGILLSSHLLVQTIWPLPTGWPLLSFSSFHYNPILTFYILQVPSSAPTPASTPSSLFVTRQQLCACISLSQGPPMGKLKYLLQHLFAVHVEEHTIENE